MTTMTPKRDKLEATRVVITIVCSWLGVKLEEGCPWECIFTIAPVASTQYFTISITGLVGHFRFIFVVALELGSVGCGLLMLEVC